MIYAIFATLLLAIRVSAQQWAQLAPTGVGPTSRTYDHVAAEYHAKRLDRSINQTRIDQLYALCQPNALILDLGCDPGFYSATIRPQCHRAVDADLSRGMIDFARCEYPGPSIHTDMRRLVKKPSGGLT
jgi:SAM-dependent methyltransferase|tara:strand:+ start:678 stop:1064 length:387 start_codon:yes stop_codon:yes gene_type:complete